MKQGGTESESVFFDLLEAVFNEVSGREVVLDIRRGSAGRGPDESSNFGNVRGQRAGLESQVATQVRNALRVRQADRLGAFISGGYLRMVLKVGAHTRHVVEHRNIQGPQVFCRTDSGKHQQLR